MSDVIRIPRFGRKVAEMGVGFLGTTGLSVAVVAWAAWPLPAFGLMLAVLLGVSVWLLRRRPARRFVALGIMGALLVPGLIAGSACVSVPLEYTQRPGTPAPDHPTNSTVERVRGSQWVH